MIIRIIASTIVGVIVSAAVYYMSLYFFDTRLDTWIVLFIAFFSVLSSNVSIDD